MLEGQIIFLQSLSKNEVYILHPKIWFLKLLSVSCMKIAGVEQTIFAGGPTVWLSWQPSMKAEGLRVALQETWGEHAKNGETRGKHQEKNKIIDLY